MLDQVLLIILQLTHPLGFYLLLLRGLYLDFYRLIIIGIDMFYDGIIIENMRFDGLI